MVYNGLCLDYCLGYNQSVVNYYVPAPTIKELDLDVDKGGGTKYGPTPLFIAKYTTQLDGAFTRTGQCMPHRIEPMVHPIMRARTWVESWPRSTSPILLNCTSRSQDVQSIFNCGVRSVL